ncbi:hypothetical protein IWX64_003218 [Arthrobacter sp. CAN_A212]|uniref:hypothetical protein n=1 Tax=Arthrobacter sp. CAN_A212 TaxID=2787719 RepID=UPI0018CBC590
MDHNSKIMPDESFPEDLTGLDDTEVQVLNSKVRRELDAEYLDSNPEPETEGRLEELTAELDRRDAMAPQPPHETDQSP